MSSRNIFIWRRSSNKLRQNEAWLEYLCSFGLSLAAIALFLVNLSSLPLLDLQESTLGQVAKEIYHSTSLGGWIFPTLWHEPYLRPPLVHDLVAVAYSIFGIGEFSTRIPGACLGAVSVLLLYQIGREVFVARLPALFSALVYLTCLPVVRYSRIAALDGPLLCFELLTIWAALRSRRNLRWAWVVGAGFSLMSLTNGLFGLQLLAVVLLFLFWDTPRLLNSNYFWQGLLLGALPSLCWYLVQLDRNLFLETQSSLKDLIFSRRAELLPIERLSSSYYLLYGVQYTLPWVMTFFAGMQLVKHNLHWGWGKLVTAWLGGYFTLNLLSASHDYCQILPLYPALALVGGKQLDTIRNLPSSVPYPRSWCYGFAAMALVAAIAGLNWGIRDYIDFYLPFICGSLCVTFSITAIVIAQQDKQFISLLFWGLLVSIFLLLISPHWLWELDASESLKPIAESIEQHTPPDTIIYSSRAVARPSLEFYSDRQIISQSIYELRQRWQQDDSLYLLVDAETSNAVNLPPTAIIEDRHLKSLGWVLAVKDSATSFTNCDL